MGGRPGVVLRGHELTSTGESLEEAVLRAVSVDPIARLSLTVVTAGGTLRDLLAEDMAELPDLGGRFNLGADWRHDVSRLPRVLPYGTLWCSLFRTESRTLGR